MSFASKGVARFDAARGARVVARTPLFYERGEDRTLDRPRHVRAGSALVAWDHYFAVIQDDASFLAILDRTNGKVRDVPFPGDRVRQFDDTRGNKSDKLDLEAALMMPGGECIVALGSGSSPLRERIVLIERPNAKAPWITIVHAAKLYAALRGETSFAGSELNVEGATLVGDDIVLFQRGNGQRRNGVAPVDATCRIGANALATYLRGAGPVPPLRDVVQWELGSLPAADGSPGDRLTFTDGATRPNGSLACLACAEASPDATRDGPVSAVTIGSIDEDARTCTFGPIVDERGAPLLDKAEGLAFDARDSKRAFVVTDRDDPTAPSELIELRLGDAW
jgi:hypothetical protein